jgi:UDP-N-acetylmuramate dehydrogenase
MFKTYVLDYIKQIVPPDDLRENEPLSRHTTFKVGGEAALFIRLSSKEQLLALVPFFKKEGIDFFILGNGSNVLVSDSGYQGAVLQLGLGLSAMRVEGERLITEAGASLARVAEFAAEQGLSGLEFAAGIPGTVGGALVMNAGAFDSEMAMVTETALLLDKNGEFANLRREELGFSYRHSIAKDQPYIFLAATLSLSKGDKLEIKEKMADLAAKRREKQPLEYASAGSTFKRPMGNYAGKLIMEAGLRGYRIGDAGVAEKHCGFVVNYGNATATDIHAVITEVQARVQANCGIMLEPEIVYLGEF